MKIYFYYFLILSVWTLQFSHGQVNEKSDFQKFPFYEEHWAVENGDGTKIELEAVVHEEKASIKLKGSPKAYLRTQRYKNFVMEFYCDGKGPGLGFRAQKDKNFEYLYLRVLSTAQRDALQYVPVYNGSLPWQLYNYPKYEGKATFPRKKVGTLPLSIENQLLEGKITEQLGKSFEEIGILFSANSEVILEDEVTWYVLEPETKKALILKKQKNTIEVLDFRTWIHTKVEVVDTKMSIFIENMKTPAFVIDNLRIPPKEGEISLIGDGNEVYFADVSIEELKMSKRIVSNSVKEKVLSNYLTKWNISEMFKKDSINMVSQIDSLLKNKNKFKSIQADSDGLINISRFYDDMTKTIALTCNLVSDSDRTVKLNFDYADHLTIVSNSEILFDKGMNFVPPSDKGIEGRVFVEDESIDLNLKNGDNELVFVLSGDNRQKYNWGLVAKLENKEGIYIKQ